MNNGLLGYESIVNFNGAFSFVQATFLQGVTF